MKSKNTYLVVEGSAENWKEAIVLCGEYMMKTLYRHGSLRFCKHYRLPVSTAGSDTSVIQESGMYHSLHTMFVNACKTKCDRVIEILKK